MAEPAALQAIFIRSQMALQKFGSLSATIISKSMSPIIEKGDQIEVKPITEALQRFDIILFKGERELICHYVWHVNQVMNQGDQDLVTTRGIPSRRDDYPVHRKDILGVVVSHRLNLWWKMRLLWANR
ncbi:MAG: hypothetical protein CME71_08760 [Halobacteriovorax sp.]|nr:hypothetical protein [Halobacteriovorax sp.]